MRINGEWLQCDDGDFRPIIRGELMGHDGVWREIEFLIDTGADRTLISATALDDSQLPNHPQNRPVGGLGGLAETVVVDAQFRCARDDGVQLLFRGRFSACIQIDALEISILGRDILDRFTLIVDRASELVVLLAGHHSYSIHEPT